MLAVNNHTEQEQVKRIFIAALSDAHAMAERTALKHAGIRNIHVYTSGVLLAEDLAKIEIANLARQEVIFCQYQLKDMTAPEFLDLIRKHPLLLHQPIVAIAANRDEGKQLERKGFELVLVRPYAVKNLEKILLQCAEFEKTKRVELLKYIQQEGRVPSSTLFFDELSKFIYTDKTLIDEITAQSALYDGINLLKAGNKEQAFKLLIKAAVEEETAGQAYMAMASIHKGSNKDLYEKTLLHAMKAYLLIGNEKGFLDAVEAYQRAFPLVDHPLSRYIIFFVNKGKSYELAKMLVAMHKIYPIEHVLPAIVDACYIKKSNEGQLASFIEVFEEKQKKAAQYLQDAAEKQKKANSTPVFARIFKKNEPEKNSQELKAALTPNSSITEMDWEEMPFVPTFDDFDEFDATLRKKKGNQFWSIVKGTAILYKNTKKIKK